MTLLGLLYRASLDLRRPLSTGALLTALLAGLGFGVLRRGLTDELAERWAVLALGVLLAGLLAGGRDATRALRRLASSGLSSAQLCAGRMLGGGLAACVLAAFFVSATGFTSSDATRELGLVGLTEGAADTWRFELPAGTSGASALELEALLPFTRAGRLEWTLQRGSATRRGTTQVTESGRVRIVLPDLSPARGNLRARLVPRDGLRLASVPPRLILGEQRVAREPLRLSRAQLLRLALVALVTLGAGCAFSASTACLAGWLVLLTPAQLTPTSLLVLAGLFAVVCTLGFALRRRTLLA